MIPPGATSAAAAAPTAGPDGASQEALALSLSTGLPFTGLRDFTVDPRLLRYVPLPLAAAQRIIPLLIVGDTLKLASAIPRPDLAVLNARFPYLTIDIVLAPGREIDLVLQRAQENM